MGYAEFDRYANDQVEDLLETYATARLNPTPMSLARIRASIVAQARAAAAPAASVDATAEPAMAPTRWRLPWHTGPVARRTIAVGMAASLAVGTTAAVLAAPPGSPFYNARLVIETAFMPSVADLDARLAAYEIQFEARLSEAERAAVASDENALAAALTAYQHEVERAVAEVGSEDAHLARLEAVLERHIAKLEALAARLPNEVARERLIAHAIAASERAVARLNDRAAGDQNGNAGGNGSQGNGSQGNGSQGNGGNQGSGGQGGSGGNGSQGNGGSGGQGGSGGSGPSSTTGSQDDLGDPGDEGDDGDDDGDVGGNKSSGASKGDAAN